MILKEYQENPARILGKWRSNPGRVYKGQSEVSLKNPIMILEESCKDRERIPRKSCKNPLKMVSESWESLQRTIVRVVEES